MPGRLKINEKSDLGKDVGNISFLLRHFIFRKKITGLAVLQLQVYMEDIISFIDTTMRIKEPFRKKFNVTLRPT